MRALLFASLCSTCVLVQGQDDRPLQRIASSEAVSGATKAAARSAFFLAGDVVIPYMLDGSGVTTRIVLQNLDTNRVTVTLNFSRFDGTSWQLATTGAAATSSLSVDVPAGGMRLIETTGASTSLLNGWVVALYDPNANVAMSSFIRFGQGNQAFDLPVGAANPLAARSLLHFDNRSGFTTRVYVVNALNKDLTLTSTWRGANGESLGTASYNVPAMGGGFASVTDAFPDSAGQIGTIDLSCTSYGLAVIARRIGPDGFYVFYPSVSSISWLP